MITDEESWSAAHLFHAAELSTEVREILNRWTGISPDNYAQVARIFGVMLHTAWRLRADGLSDQDVRDHCLGMAYDFASVTFVPWRVTDIPDRNEFLSLMRGVTGLAIERSRQPA